MTARLPLVALSLLLVISIAPCPADAQTPPARSPRDLAGIAGWKGAAPNSPGAFTFVVVGDRTGGHVGGQWAEAVKQVNLLKPDFVMCVGDLIEGYTEDEGELIRQWDNFDAMTSKFDAPFFYCPGNHDVTNDMMHEVYVKRHGAGGRSYYSFDYRGCHFVVLDSMTAGRNKDFADEQLRWLAADLAAAKQAEHVFVFYHHPLWANADLWNRIRKLLPNGKTTVFNGHWHRLTFELADDIPTYVLGATGTGGRKDPQRLLTGSFSMFAQVAVDRGGPTIALLPLYDLLPGDYAKFVTTVAPLFSQSGPPVFVSSKGGAFTFRQPNPFGAPLAVTVTGKGTGWKLSPQVVEFTVKAGQTALKQLSLTPLTPSAEGMTLVATYKFRDPNSRQMLELKREMPLGIYAELDIPTAKITVDGELDDFAGVKALRIAGEKHIASGKEHWSSPEDSSFAVQAARDSKRLYVAVDVTDDQIHVDGKEPWENDAVEFFWDVRPVENRTGGHADGTGQLIVVAPDKDGKLTHKWYMGNRAAPKGLTFAGRRRPGGYVIELSMPLSEMGMKAAPAPGGEILLDIQLDDRDKVAGDVRLLFMTTSGTGNGYKSTAAYAHGTFR